MLTLPDKGIHRSITVHNVDLNILTDWIEASVVFVDEQLSKSDVIDVLMEEQIYESQSFAAEKIEVAWNVISLRMNYLDHPLGINVNGNRITRTDTWEIFPAYGFCLTLSCVSLYSHLPTSWENGYGIQGELFEELVLETFNQTLPKWTVKRIGWSGTSNPISLVETLPTIISDLNETEGAEYNLHIDKTVKDMGLDLLAFYSFGDEQASIPVLLVQCASGRNWTSKRNTPDIDLWKKIISFNSQPVRAFAMPFAFADTLEFRKEAAHVNGVFIDRYRLLKAFRQKDASVSNDLNKRLENWIRPRIDQLPRVTS